MNRPKLSIITVCYNEKNIEATCLNIANQSYQDFEWIVMDGGSKDGTTLETLRRFEDRIDVLVSEPDRGIYHAMNKGIERATGEYLIFMNGGDYFLDIFSLERFFDHFQLVDPIVCCDAVFLLDGGKVLVREFKDWMPIDADFFRTRCIAHQATFIQKRLFEEYGGYDESLKIVSDWKKWVEWTSVHKIPITHVENLLAMHHYTGISSRFDETHTREKRQVMDEFFPDQAEYMARQQQAELSEPASSEASAATFERDSGMMITKYHLFSCIPIWKYTRNNDTRVVKHYLFGFFLIFKSKEK